MQLKPEPKHTDPRRAPKPGVAGVKQSAHTSTRQGWRAAAENRSQNTHTHGAQPSQELRGASGAPRPAHKQPNTPARSGGA